MVNNMTDKTRDAFEARFLGRHNIIYRNFEYSEFNSGYVYTGEGRRCDNDSLRLLNARWEAWQAALEHKAKEINAMREIIEAVAHIGVDFGYGQFNISPDDDLVKVARAILSATTDKEQ